ncbi:MAG TPA: hypothetical protein VL528_04700 [Oxalicibacterium sp.]|nr:hypothetical protein [Oxalicibacterium sp.]
MRITGKINKDVPRPTRLAAMSLAMLFAAGAMWALMPEQDAGISARQSVAQAHAAHAGHMLIPSGVPDQASRGIDRAIARGQRAEHDAAGAATDAVYRIEPATALRKGQRVMT